MAAGREIVDCTPHKSLMRKIGSASFSVSESISELLANSFDARVNEAPVNVTVDIAADRIVVRDDGRGMPIDVLKFAVRMAWPMQDVVSYGADRKREFGIGMKTACASLGDKWQIFTAPVKGEQAFRVDFDLTEWATAPADSDSAWQIGIEKMPVANSPFSTGAPHGTILLIERLKVKPILGALKSELARAYMPHLKLGDSIEVNGEPLKAPDYEIITGSRVEIEIEILGHTVRGWGGLMQKSSQRSMYGFHLYRQGQLIETFDKSFIPVHPTSARIIGEVHLDFVPVNFTKKGFEKESREWYLAREALRKRLKPLVGEARKKQGKFKRTKMEDQKLADAKGAAESTVAGAQVAIGHLRDKTEARPAGPSATPSRSATEPPLAPTSAPTRHDLVVNGQPVHIQHQFAPLGEQGPVRSHFFDKAASELVVFTNSESALVRLGIPPEALLLFHVSEAVAEFLFDSGEMDAPQSRKFAMEWQKRMAEAMRPREKVTPS